MKDNAALADTLERAERAEKIAKENATPAENGSARTVASAEVLNAVRDTRARAFAMGEAARDAGETPEACPWQCGMELAGVWLQGYLGACAEPVPEKRRRAPAPKTEKAPFELRPGAHVRSRALAARDMKR